MPPTVLREALSKMFADEERFQLGELDDAAEALVCILAWIDTRTRFLKYNIQMHRLIFFL